MVVAVACKRKCFVLQFILFIIVCYISYVHDKERERKKKSLNWPCPWFEYLSSVEESDAQLFLI